MRKCCLISKSDTGHKEVYVCAQNSKEIFAYILDNKLTKKFHRTLHKVYQNASTRDIYENYSAQVSVFKFKGRVNTRIYCKVAKGVPHKITLVSVEHSKNSQNLDKKLQSITNAIEECEYEYYQFF